jgi:hypothetical protein
LDLIQLWEDHRFISSLTWQIGPPPLGTSHVTSPTLKFDSIYSEILSHSPELLSVLKTQIISPWSLISVFNCGLPFNYKILQPFLYFRGLLELPFPHGDSPVDFLNDPRRAGNLYSDPQDIADAFMRFQIPRIKQDLLDGWPPEYL